MIKTQINEIIQLHPSLLSKKLVHNVTNEISKKKISKCFEKYGYVLGIENLTLGEIMISNCTGLLDCSVRYVANCLHPKPNSTYQGRVCLVFHLGVLVDVGGVLKVLIPYESNGFTIHLLDGSSNCIPYSFSDTEHPLYYIGTDIKHTKAHPLPNTIGCGVILKIKISCVEFNAVSQIFNCYGVFTY